MSRDLVDVARVSELNEHGREPFDSIEIESVDPLSLLPQSYHIIITETPKRKAVTLHMAFFVQSCVMRSPGASSTSHGSPIAKSLANG